MSVRMLAINDPPVRQRREQRRKNKALEKVVDPEKAARARINKSANRAAARKRKIQGRGAPTPSLFKLERETLLRV